jgi:hypothetical protein
MDSLMMNSFIYNNMETDCQKIRSTDDLLEKMNQDGFIK